MTGAVFLQFRHFGRAACLGIGTAGMEMTARRRFDRAGNITLQNGLLASDGRVGDGYRRQQRLGIGVLRVGKQGFLVGVFDDFAQIHHRDAMADVFDHGQIMGDEQVRQVQLRLQIHQQVNNLGLDRDIKGRDRLVTDDHLRVQGQGPGDANALTLTAGKFVGVAFQLRLAQAHALEQLRYLLLAFGRGADVVNAQHFLDNTACRHARVQ